MASAVPIGAADEKFLKFDTFSCVFKAFFRFPFPVRGRTAPQVPPLATPMLLSQRRGEGFPKVNAKNESFFKENALMLRYFCYKISAL